MHDQKVVMPVFSWRPTTEADCEELLQNIREFSKEDLLVTSSNSREGLLASIEGSRNVYTGFVDGRVGLIYGMRIINILSGHVYLWLLTTKLAEEYWVTFSRGACIYVNDLLNEFEYVSCICPLRNKKSAKWLKYIGFIPGPVVRQHGIKFRTFSITRETVNTEKLNWFMQGDDRWQPLRRSLG